MRFLTTVVNLEYQEKKIVITIGITINQTMSYHSILAPSHATVQAAKPALGSNLREDAGPNFNESLFPLLQSLQPPTGQVLRVGVVCGGLQPQELNWQ